MNYIFYHSNCMDGLCAAWVTLEGLKNNLSVQHNDITIRSVHYQEPVPEYDYQPNDVIYIVDFSYKHDVLVRLSEKCRVVVLDHHKSAQKELSGLDFAFFDMTKSGAGMAWWYFFPNTPMPEVVKMIQDRDLWKFDLPLTKPFSAALQSDPRRHDMLFWTELVYGTNNVLETLIEKGKMLLDEIDGVLENFITKQKFKIIEWHGHRVAVFNTTVLFSEMGEVAYQKLAIDFSMSYFVNDEGRVIFSLRSPKGGVDVGDIAVKHGGGGHSGSAGFSYNGVKGFIFLSDLYHA